ncbi:NACHT and WD repeat domain-containing protein 2 isoform X2 [Boleophthalmus pectinirostris]|uniref:NACHT and WD repeat domain-containing protein 2 isoform X2 n=1 Tax=Boleophthalmus pectinirostris TaxID=150288 RepID=UPI0024314232|nr:NACHT and WD repeat domain-containing protein 2 isoform X2 [Boleophthalmus pectinirostris]
MTMDARSSSSCVKIYLSSNPEDSVVERRALREGVFSSFREHCRHTLGLDVRVIDPFESPDLSKWPDEKSRKQMIKECRESSAGPFLLALVGHEYGVAALPCQLEVQEYQMLLQESQRAGLSTAELERVYTRDENSIPPSYRLQPQASNEQATCKNVFQTAVDLCVLNGKMTSEKAQNYCRSTLDVDLRYALEDNGHKDISGRCLIYIHKVIISAKDKSHHQPKLQDSAMSTLLTPEALLTALCDSLLSLVLPFNLQVYTTTTECPLSYTPARRTCYTDSLCHQVTSDLEKMTEHLNISFELLLSDAFAREQLEQDELCNVISQCYEIYRPEEENIRNFVQNEQWRPLVITGGPCTGKTVLLAHCSEQIKSWLPESDPVVISYFCSLSVNPSPKHLLSSLCYQIAKRYHSTKDYILDAPHTSSTLIDLLNYRVYTDSDLTLSEQKQHILSLMTLLPSPKHPLVIFINGLDQMDYDYGCQVIESLPFPLPPSVKLLLTASSKQKHIEQAVELHYPQCTLSSESEAGKELFSLQLGPPNRKESVKMLTSLLSASGRRITSGQQALVNQALATCCLPLYVRLLHKLTSLWQSDSEVSESTLPDGVHAAISTLLDHLELKHGSPLVSHAVCYLTLSRTGLTEAELTDLLSNDNKILAHYTKLSHCPLPKMRVPQVDVEKVLLDLQPFLLRRTVAGSVALFWISRHFGLVITKRYLDSPTARREFHSDMADYFSGRWSCGCSKPLNQDNNDAKPYIDRQPSSQPFFFMSSSKETGNANLKKILELPYHLRESSQLEELRKLVLTLEFQQAMIGSDLVVDLVAMLERNEEFGKEHPLLANILKSSICFLNSFPLEIPSVMELVLLPYKSIFPNLEGYANAIQQERKKRGVSVLLHPAPSTIHAFKCVKSQVEDRSLRDAIATECGTVVLTMCDGSVWVCKSNANELFKLTLSSENGDITFGGLHSSGHLILLSSFSHKHFLWDVTGTDVLLEVKDSNKTPKEVENIVTSQENLCIQWKGKHFVSVYKISNGILNHFCCQNLVTCVACSSTMLVCGHDKGTLSIFDIKTTNLLQTCSNSKLETVVSITVCCKKQRIGCIDNTGCTTLWDVSTEQPNLVKETFLKAKSNNILNTDYASETHAFLVCQAKQITLWDTCEWEVSDQFLAPKQKAFKHALLSQDGHFLLALLDTSSSVLVWKLSTGDCILPLETFRVPHRLLKTTSDIVCVNHDGSIALWDSEMIHIAGIACKMAYGVKEVVVEGDGNGLFTSDGSDTVWKWTVEMGQPCAHVLHCNPVEKMRLSPNNAYLVTLSSEDIYIWQTGSGQNIVRVGGSRVSDILITPNSKFGVSLSEHGLSHVWKLVSGATICTIHLYLSDAQISAESTFLIGRHRGELLAANLWSGSINKRFSCDEVSEIIGFQTLTNHPNFVIVLLTSGSLYTWNVAEETVCRHFKIPFNSLPNNFKMSGNGNYTLLSTHHETLTVLDMSKFQLCSIKTSGNVITTCLDSSGCFVICCSRPKSNCECFLHTRPILSVIRLEDGSTVGSLYLPKSPLSLAVIGDLSVAVGFEDGAVGVYSFNGEKSISRVEKSHLRKCPIDQAPRTWLPLTTPNIQWS